MLQRELAVIQDVQKYRMAMRYLFMRTRQGHTRMCPVRNLTSVLLLYLIVKVTAHSLVAKLMEVRVAVHTAPPLGVAV